MRTLLMTVAVVGLTLGGAAAYAQTDSGTPVTPQNSDTMGGGSAPSAGTAPMTGTMTNDTMTTKSFGTGSADMNSGSTPAASGDAAMGDMDNGTATQGSVVHPMHKGMMKGAHAGKKMMHGKMAAGTAASHKMAMKHGKMRGERVAAGCRGAAMQFDSSMSSSMASANLTKATEMRNMGMEACNAGNTKQGMQQIHQATSALKG